VKQKSEENVPLLPANRAFVIQLSTDTEVSQGRLAGRIEHIVSGQIAHFQSIDELLAFIGHLLTTHHKEDLS
jgi:rhodanese-related sulfurtransferase